MRVVVFGASRGLGRAIAEVAFEAGYDVLGVSRKRPDSAFTGESFIELDLSRAENFAKCAEIASTAEHIFYCAGGGPYGPFRKKRVTAHEWAYAVNFLAPAHILHAVLQGQGSFLAIGSQIVESGTEENSASYAAAKIALTELIKRLAAEEPGRVRLAAPGYMDTSMIPANAWPRQKGERLLDPRDTAERIWEWVLSTGPEWKLEIPN